MLLVTTGNNSFGEEFEEVTLKIGGMSSACCVPKVEEALLKVEGVKKVSACFKRGIAKVEIESGQVTVKQLVEAVKIAGFKAKVGEMKEEVINLRIEVLENQIRGLNIVLGALQSATGEICKGCIGLEGAKTKVGKMVNKLSMDLDAASISCEKTKADLKSRIENLSKAAENLKVAEERKCLKTSGKCKLGEACFINAIIDLIKPIK